MREQSVGGVGEAVGVEEAGDGEVRSDDQDRGDARRPELDGHEPDTGEDRADEAADEREPAEGRPLPERR